MRPERFVVLIVCALLVAFSSACGPISSITIGQSKHPTHRAVRGESGGPPPHAPAHGYRHKQRHSSGEVELVFDSGLGVYAVVDIPDRYYWNGYYLRLDGDQWYESAELSGGWEPMRESGLPSGLKQQKSHQKAKGKKKKEKKAGPARGRW